MIKYSEITEEDLPKIINMYKKHLNSGQYITETIKNGFYSDKYIGYKAVNNGRIVGFISSREGIDFTYPHPELEEKIINITNGKKVCTPDGMLVIPEYRGNGISHDLHELMREGLINYNFNLALLELWIYPDGRIPALNLVKLYGKVVYQEEIAGFYKDSKKYNISCPLCGEHCICGAMIQLIELQTEE